MVLKTIFPGCGVRASLMLFLQVEAPSAGVRTATQAVDSPGANVATQPVEASGARPVIHPYATGASAEEIQTTRPVEQSLNGKKTLPPVTATGVSTHLDVD